jgi:hypothetical protein
MCAIFDSITLLGAENLHVPTGMASPYTKKFEPAILRGLELRIMGIMAYI